jgi:P27 family predicted phage terminase small subunit
MDTTTAPRRKNPLSVAHAKTKRKPRKPPIALSAVPEPPPELSAASAREWRRVLPSLLALGLHPTLDLQTLLLYCRSVGDAEDVRQDWILRGSPSVVLRPSGEREHPAIATLRQLGADIAKHAAALGMNPRARKALGVELAAAVIEAPPAPGVKREIDRTSRFFDD